MTDSRTKGARAMDDARLWREQCRERGEHVVFTNGCFDILHPGHIEMLEASRSCGDALVVALNTDASVRRLKGEGRPIVPESERAEVLAALWCVDCVVLFDEDTPLQAILALRPDVLVKGADWAEDAIVGAPEVRSWGGRVERIPLVAGASTTSIVERVRALGEAR